MALFVNGPGHSGECYHEVFLDLSGAVSFLDLHLGFGAFTLTSVCCLFLIDIFFEGNIDIDIPIQGYGWAFLYVFIE